MRKSSNWTIWTRWVGGRWEEEDDVEVRGGGGGEREEGCGSVGRGGGGEGGGWCMSGRWECGVATSASLSLTVFTGQRSAPPQSKVPPPPPPSHQDSRYAGNTHISHRGDSTNVCPSWDGRH